MKRTLTFAALITLGAAGFMPLPSVAQTDFRVIINTAPPPPRFESVPAPRHGYVWAPGFWNWEHNRHVWTPGHWESARSGYEYRRTEWIRDNDGYRLDRGGWRQVAQRDYDVVRVAPPPPRYERVPRPRAGHVWVPGHWEWRGNRHAWVGGQWMRERAGYVYSQPAWIQRDGHWYMEPARWSRHGEGRDRDRDGIPDRLEHRDRDRDGVPDAYDRDRDNDGVPNRADRDRDGDGVPNHRDGRPDNPRRD
ncbi:hypothetical protein [Massilia atriviolacea]|uniref:hypothetical protein n=1 Tax=Massilia atriviolacea TaxID=2495579 RepID=UPI0026976B61|nr:hypothetical protein [Massilia atriviolacea]